MANADTFERYHQILLLPLEMTGKSASPELPIPWKTTDRRDRGTWENPQTPYQEFVYFHPFARKFLYPSETERQHFTLEARRDVRWVRVGFHKQWRNGSRVEIPEEVLEVDRVHLYRFRQHQVAVLAVEISAKRPISREAVLLLEDQFRRIYPPYWEKGTDATPEWEGGHCPGVVQWLDENRVPFADPGARSNYEEASSLEAATDGGKPPMASHWQWLLRGFDNYEQIEDDRAPAMVFLAHQNPRLVSQGDRIRHCFYDGPGDPLELPYSKAFLAEFEKDFAYTRFWEPSPATNWMTTSYTCCGYGFTLLVAADHYGDTLREHFRHHYFQIGLLAHFHRAVLLRFSNRFTGVTDSPDDQTHYESLVQVRTDFARFISSSWFHEASNQEQGRELFEFWTRHLRTDELMKNIVAEAHAVDAVLSAKEQTRLREAETAEGKRLEGIEEERNRESFKLARRVDRLTVLLYGVAGASLLVALLDVEAVKELIRDTPARGNALEPEPVWFWKWNLTILFLGGAILSALYHTQTPPEGRGRKQAGEELAQERNWSLTLFWIFLSMFIVFLSCALSDVYKLQLLFHRIFG